MVAACMRQAKRQELEALRLPIGIMRRSRVVQAATRRSPSDVE